MRYIHGIRMQLFHTSFQNPVVEPVVIDCFLYISPDLVLRIYSTAPEHYGRMAFKTQYLVFKLAFHIAQEIIITRVESFLKHEVMPYEKSQPVAAVIEQLALI